MKKLLIGTTISLIIATTGTLIYFQKQNSQPPSLNPETSIFQGFIKSDKDSKYKGFIKFENSDKAKFEKLKDEKIKDGKELRLFTATKENQGVHYIYFNESKTAKEVIEQMNPTAKAVVVAVYNAAVNKWDITEQDFYDSKATNIKKPEDLTIPAGKSAVIVTAGTTEIFDAKDGQHKATYEFKPCEQTSAGWYNYAMTESKGLNISECSNSVKDVFVQTNNNPVEFDKITNITDYKPGKYSLVWVNFKEIPKKNSSETPTPVMTEVQVASVTQTKVTLTWKKPAGVENYSIEYKKSGEDDSKYATYKTLSDSSEVLLVEVSDLTPSTEYTFRVKALANQTSSSPNYAMATTLPKTGYTPADPENPPTDLTATPTSDNSAIKISWKAPVSSTDVNGYKISIVYSNGTVVTNPLSKETVSYELKPYTFGENYKITVTAKYDDVDDPSISIDYTAPKDPQSVVKFDPVTNATSKLNTDNSISVTWTAPVSDKVKGYMVITYEDGVVLKYSPVLVGTNTFNYSETSAGKTYKFDVIAKYSTYYTDQKSVAVTTNEIKIPAAVTAVIAPAAPTLSATTNPIKFSWTKPTSASSYKWKFTDTAGNLILENPSAEIIIQYKANFPSAWLNCYQNSKWSCNELEFVNLQSKFEAGKEYKFLVQAQDGDLFSEWAEVKFTVPSPIKLEITKAEFLFGDVYNKGDDAIKISFDNPSKVDLKLYFKNTSSTSDYQVFDGYYTENEDNSITITQLWNLGALGKYKFKLKGVAEDGSIVFSNESSEITYQ